MKHLATTAFLAILLFTGCKTENKKEPTSTAPVETAAVEKELTFTEKIAYANGYENWKDVEELKFTFNVDREGNPHFERSWSWKPKTNEVTMSAEDTLNYNREDMDSTLYETDGNFINDKYWLLAPINILWDKKNTTTEHTMEAEAPISKNLMQKLTVTYGQDGGYTPGDAYDLYFTDDYIVKEWVFRKGNQAEPSMATTWEDYTDMGGLKIAEMHKNEEGNFKLYFTGVEVINE